MKIVVLDKPREFPGEIDWSEVNKLGEARIYDDTLQENIIETIADAEIVFVNKLHITREVMDACPNIKYISVVATGFNKIDLEAAKEISKQIRLRDISGIIIIDFIDVKEPENKRLIINEILKNSKKDRSKIQIEEFTKLNLMELTRKHINSKKED